MKKDDDQKMTSEESAREIYMFIGKSSKIKRALQKKRSK